MEIISVLEKFEVQTRNVRAFRAHGVKKKDQSYAERFIVFNLFKKWLMNWRFLVSTGNKDELIRKTKCFLEALPKNVHAYGSYPKQGKFFKALKIYLMALSRWTPETQKKAC